MEVILTDDNASLLEKRYIFIFKVIESVSLLNNTSITTSSNENSEVSIVEM